MTTTSTLAADLDAIREYLESVRRAEQLAHGYDGASPAVVQARIQSARAAAVRQQERAAAARRQQLAARRDRRDAVQAHRDAAAVRATVCGSCFTVHAGECY